MKCPKCQGEMIEGNYSDDTGIPVNWNIKKKVLGFMNVQTSRIETKVYRCKNCGYLESYAK